MQEKNSKRLLKNLTLVLLVTVSLGSAGSAIGKSPYGNEASDNPVKCEELVEACDKAISDLETSLEDCKELSSKQAEKIEKDKKEIERLKQETDGFDVGDAAVGAGGISMLWLLLLLL